MWVSFACDEVSFARDVEVSFVPAVHDMLAEPKVAHAVMRIHTYM